MNEQQDRQVTSGLRSVLHRAGPPLAPEAPDKFAKAVRESTDEDLQDLEACLSVFASRKVPDADLFRIASLVANLKYGLMIQLADELSKAAAGQKIESPEQWAKLMFQWSDMRVKTELPKKPVIA